MARADYLKCFKKWGNGKSGVKTISQWQKSILGKNMGSLNRERETVILLQTR